MFLTSRQVRNKYNNGVILQNRQNNIYVTIFSFIGIHFTSTIKRAKKGKHYRLDNPYWMEHREQGVLEKIRMIMDKEVKVIGWKLWKK